MKLLALLVLCFSFPFLLTASNTLSGLSLTVFEEVENLFYNSEIVSVAGGHENLYGLMSFTEDLKKIFIGCPFKTKSELYEIAFDKFEEALRATGEFDKPYSLRIYNLFQDFVLRQSPAFGQVELSHRKSREEEFPELIRMNSLGSIDSNNLGSLNFDFEACNDFTSFPDDVLNFVDETYSLPTVGSLLEPPSKPVESKRAYDADLAAKKWSLAANKLSRFHMKIYFFAKGLTDPDRSLSSKFLKSTIISTNLKKIFTENADTKAPFFERSIADHFSSEVEKFVATLDVQNQEIIDLFIASVMEIGNEIYKEIKDEIKEIDPEAEIIEREFKRKRIETRGSPIDFSNLSHEPLDFFHRNIDENFKVEDEQFKIPPSNKSANSKEDYVEEEKEERIPDDDNEEDFISIATPEELSQPETVEFLNDPFDHIQDVMASGELQQFDRIRSIYYGLVERDFEGLGEDGQVILGTVLDEALNKVFKRK